MGPKIEISLILGEIRVELRDKANSFDKRTKRKWEKRDFSNLGHAAKRGISPARSPRKSVEPPRKAARKIPLTFVTVFFGNLLGNVLNLEQELDPLNGGDGGLRNRGGDAAGGEILQKGHRIRKSGLHFGGLWQKFTV